MTDDLYQAELLDHYYHPHNFGSLPQPSCFASESNASCGDKLTLELNIDSSKQPYIVTDAKFNGVGCAVSIASASLLTDYIKGKSLEELHSIDVNFMQDLIGTTISPGRVKCLTISAKALMKALSTALDSGKI